VRSLHPKPTPEELNAHYERYYLTVHEDDPFEERLIDLHGPIVEWLRARLAEHKAPSVLDFGFGSGCFLKQAARSGFGAFGSDLSSGNVSQLREYCDRTGTEIRIVPDTREGIQSLGMHSFDLITLFQVVEHLREPLRVLRDLARLQQPGAKLYIECPNNDATLGRIKNFIDPLLPRSLAYDSLKYPEHIHGFTRKSLQVLLRQAGYLVEECDSYHYRDQIHQVEAERWWPAFGRSMRLTTMGVVKSLVPIADALFLRMFGEGSGLYALARRATQG
jgi:2-polyprenyl-3-methyl-5-hydroxy-6-metoxy-1,4-benzoquinol methylase